MSDSNSGVVDYDDIKNSVEEELGHTPDGWAGLVTDLFQKIKEHCDKQEIEYPVVSQIKQKFGQLRIYFGTVVKDERIDSLIQATIERANHSCEKCSNAAQVQLVEGFVATLCCWCAHELVSSRRPQSKRLFGDGRPVKDGMACNVCGYRGQIDRTDEHGRCPACVKKNW
ncbi:hypothetical protein [Ruegeria lacuscaerulensis]|uniref:hypothetical protein n=1 Tax=Ruegeria lacuscaerulensis TaxID=55218 RepID=UPI00147DDB24|nr:hypothetical protein [Ruegeria lacuscaerulensis]